MVSGKQVDAALGTWFGVGDSVHSSALEDPIFVNLSEEQIEKLADLQRDFVKAVKSIVVD